MANTVELLKRNNSFSGGFNGFGGETSSIIDRNEIQESVEVLQEHKWPVNSEKLPDETLHTSFDNVEPHFKGDRIIDGVSHQYIKNGSEQPKFEFNAIQTKPDNPMKFLRFKGKISEVNNFDATDYFEVLDEFNQKMGEFLIYPIGDDKFGKQGEKYSATWFAKNSEDSEDSYRVNSIIRIKYSTREEALIAVKEALEIYFFVFKESKNDKKI